MEVTEADEAAAVVLLEEDAVVAEVVLSLVSEAERKSLLYVCKHSLQTQETSTNEPGEPGTTQTRRRLRRPRR